MAGTNLSRDDNTLIIAQEGLLKAYKRHTVRPGGVVVKASDFHAVGPGFESTNGFFR